MTTLESTQQSHLQSLIDSGNYADGYQYVKDIVDAARQGESDSSVASDLEVTSKWFESAASINANDGSFISDYVRAAIKSVGELVGKPVSDADFQEGSDALAEKFCLKS